MATGATILGYAQDTLGFDRTSVGVPGLEPTQLLAHANQAVLEYFDAFRKNGQPPSRVSKETGYALVADQNLAADVASGATSFTIDDSSSYGASGAIAIWDDNRPDYTEFTGNDLSTAISGVTGVDFAHETDDNTQLLYALPSNFVDFRQQEGNPAGVTVDGHPYTFTSSAPYGSRFAIYDNGTTKYLNFPEGLTGDVFVKYNADPTTVDEESDSVDVPTRDEWFVVYRICQKVAPLLDKDPNYYENQANLVLGDALKRRNINKRPRTRPIRRTATLTRSDLFG